MTIGEIFANALRNKVGKQACVFDYGDKKTFVDLWTTKTDNAPVPVAFKKCMVSTNESCKDQSKKRSIIVVWDGRAVAEEGAWVDLLKPHLTPMDWALAFSIRALGQQEIPDCAYVAIHIVDLTGQDHDAWSMRMRHQLLADMPWVTLHAPLIPQGAYRSGYRPILDGCNSLLTHNGSGWTLRTGSATLKKASSRGYGRHLEDMTRQWASTLVQSHDHHDLNNLVGPWILASETPQGYKCKVPSLFAFWTKLRWTGFFLPEKSLSAGGGTRTDPCMGGLDVLAIDDQLTPGWGHVIRCLFGATENGKPGGIESCQLIGTGGETRVYGSEKADFLLAHLEDCGKYNIRHYDSPIPCQDGQRTWILVLDLLLFPGKPTEERKWFEQLRCIAKKITDAPASGLAWPGFSEEELVSIETWLKRSGDNNDPAYDTALSLLPRLCALRWPSVPIMLFSGTARSALVARLADYRNIFLAPSKPNLFSGNPMEQVNVFFSGWHKEINSTKGLIRVQRELLRLVTATPSESASANGTDNGGADGAENTLEESLEDSNLTPDDGNAHRHLTIAFDESGDFKTTKNSAIGGILIEAVANDECNAKSKTTKFLEKLRKDAVNFYDRPPYYTDTKNVGVGGHLTVAKNSNISRKIKCVLNLSLFECVRIGAFRCIVPQCLYESGGPPDGTYLNWSTRTLELLLCEYLHSCGYDLNATSLSIWLPTRAVGEDENRNLATRFDLFSISEQLMQTVGGYSLAYAIVLRSLEGRQASKILERCQLKLRKIPYTNTGITYRPYEGASHWYCGGCGRFVARVVTAKGSMVTCSRCQNGSLPADYSVAQHLADASLSNWPNNFPHDNFGACNIDADISFDVIAGRRLAAFLDVGRLFARESKTEGFKVAYDHSFFVTGFRFNHKGSENSKAPVQARIVGSLRDHAKRVDGNTLIELAGLSRSITRFTITKGSDGSWICRIRREVRRMLENLLVVDDVPKLQSGRTKSGTGKPKLTFDIDTADVPNVIKSIENLDVNIAHSPLQ